MVTTAVAPGASVPLVCERLIQGADGDAIQPTAMVLLVFLSVYVWPPGLNGPPTGPAAVMPLPGVTVSSSGKSNASITPRVVVAAGTVALEPRPRLAKALQSSARLAPPLFTRSA